MKTLIKNKNNNWSTCLACFFMLCTLSFTGCKKFVDILPPTSQLVTASVFNNNASATSAQVYIYTQMWGNQSYFMAQHLGLYADELQNFSTNVAQKQLYTNALVASATGISYGIWSSAAEWGYIYDANAVISGLQTTVGCSPAVKQQLTGEALFVRAFWHFYFTNIYGDVPIVLTTSYTVNGDIARSPRVAVLQQVVADLQQANRLLNRNYVDATDTATTNERVRPNKAAALALLARTYLYLGDYSKNTAYYAKADSAASAVISNSNYSLSPLSGVFLENNTEAIWQIQTPSPALYDTGDGGLFILRSAPNAKSTNNSTTISQQLMSSFEPGDQRATQWIGNYTANSVTYYFPYKYKNYTLKNQEYETVLRLGEQYLIRAEARVHEGNLGGAASDLNMIRNRAGLANTTAATANDLATAILHERQVELFTEWGARWFDLCRTGNAPAVMSVVTPQKGGTWNPDNHQLLFPIPQSDRNSDINLSQNPGY